MADVTYASVRTCLEAILIGLCLEGKATLSGQSESGPTYVISDPEAFWRYVELAGLLEDEVPWWFCLKAYCELAGEAPGS